ncbi:MAG: DUF3883 domain-containing protein [Planctomycetota bacterium]
MQNLVLFNIGWMKHYRGQTEDDKIVNGGAHVQKHHEGGEVWNFEPIKGVCYAFARSNRGGNLNLARLGAVDGAPNVDGITVVFTATRPGGGRVVAGWYKNARVWREVRKLGARGLRHGWDYVAEAKIADCKLLNPDDRVFSVPRAKKGVWGLGQSNVRYVDEPAAKPFLQALSKYVASPMAANVTAAVKSHGQGRQQDPALRAKVEVAAINRVVDFYTARGFACRSVERDDVGWDLEAERGDVTLLVEVKGCSGAAVVAEVTPNEFAQMKRRRNVYRLAIVTNAMDKRKSHLSIVSYNIADRSWRNEEGQAAQVKEIVAARISVGA